MHSQEILIKLEKVGYAIAAESGVKKLLSDISLKRIVKFQTNIVFIKYYTNQNLPLAFNVGGIPARLILDPNFLAFFIIVSGLISTVSAVL